MVKRLRLQYMWGALAIFMAAALSGCREVRIENGELPSEYVEIAERYMGLYSGAMGNDRGRILLAMKDRRVIALFSSPSGPDALDPLCNSRIGQLKSVLVDSTSSGEYQLKKARFHFDPGYCWPSVKGREIIFNFEERPTSIMVTASIRLEQDTTPNCRIHPGNPSAGQWPREVCTDKNGSDFASGQFLLRK